MHARDHLDALAFIGETHPGTGAPSLVVLREALEDGSELVGEHARSALDGQPNTRN